MENCLLFGVGSSHNSTTARVPTSARHATLGRSLFGVKLTGAGMQGCVVIVCGRGLLCYEEDEEQKERVRYTYNELRL